MPLFGYAVRSGKEPKFLLSFQQNKFYLPHEGKRKKSDFCNGSYCCSWCPNSLTLFGRFGISRPTTLAPPAATGLYLWYSPIGHFRWGIWEPETLPKDDIRFINSSYDEQFRSPNADTIEIEYPDRTTLAKCEYFDDLHA